jgi:drug/metabolite transporter (DMT)-like permease
VTAAAAPWKVWTALGLVYVFWGSTYLAISYVVQTLAPLLSASLRFSVAGALMAVYLLVVRRGPTVPVTARQVATAAVTGVLLLLGGNGLVTLAEQRELPSGLAALLIAAVPLWVVLMRAGTGDRPERRTVAGVALGFVGVALLLLPGARPEGVALLPALMVVGSGLLWSLGSFAASRLPLPSDPVLTTVLQMVAGGLSLAVVGALAGEDLVLSESSTASLVGLGYLVVFGSIVAFSAYSWLLGVAPVSVVSTYAYVNPVVAVLLGVLIAGEAVSGTTVVGGAVTVLAVAVVVSRGAARRPRAPEALPAGDRL